MSKSGEILLFQTEDGQTRIDVRLVGETVWLSAGQIAELFQRDKSTISRHIQNVFDEGELKPESVVALFATTAADRKTYRHSLDAQPSPVEVHFDEAVKKARQLAQPKKRTGKKSEGGK